MAEAVAFYDRNFGNDPQLVLNGLRGGDLHKWHFSCAYSDALRAVDMRERFACKLYNPNGL
jgi:hypothetical protein